MSQAETKFTKLSAVTTAHELVLEVANANTAQATATLTVRKPGTTSVITPKRTATLGEMQILFDFFKRAKQLMSG